MRLGPELQATSSLTLNISPSCTLEVKLKKKNVGILISLHTADPHLHLNVCITSVPWQKTFQEEEEQDYPEIGEGKDLLRKKSGGIVQGPSLMLKALKAGASFCSALRYGQCNPCTFFLSLFVPSPTLSFSQPDEYLITFSKGAAPTGGFWTDSGRLKAEGRALPQDGGRMSSYYCSTQHLIISSKLESSGRAVCKSPHAACCYQGHGDLLSLIPLSSSRSRPGLLLMVDPVRSGTNASGQTKDMDQAMWG